MAERNKRARNWCFTLNNPDVAVQEVLRAQAEVRFACGQTEVGEGGTEHVQGYIEFTKPMSLRGLRKVLPRAHWEVRRGTAEQARDYCRKAETAVAGTQWEFGQFGGHQGRRNDLADVQRELREGTRVCEIYNKYPQIAARYPRFIDRCADICTAPRNWKTEIRVFLGPTECGKTRLAHELYPDIWTRPDGSWFDGYDRYPHVLFDDFDGGRDCGISFRFLLRLLDRYPLQVPIKGGFKEWVPKVIIITTNVEPRAWYPWEQFAPLERRIDEIRRWTPPTPP